MAIIGTLPVTLQNGTTADATQVMSDFNFIVNQVNANALPTSFVAPGTFINVQRFLTPGVSTYTPFSDATKALVYVMGAGGAGGGTIATGVGQSAGGVGAGAGAFGIGYISSGLTTQTVTVGAQGAGVSGSIGGIGGSTSFGGLFVAGGGQGGNAGNAVTPPNASTGGASGGLCTGTGTFLFAGGGQTGFASIVLAVGVVINGSGGGTAFGSGGTINAGTATGYGAGGGGAAASQSTGPQAGSAGAQGICIVFEFA